MIQLDPGSIDLLIGWAAAPALLLALTSHIKRFFAAMPWTQVEPANKSPWPLTTDALAVAYVKLMALDGRLYIGGDAGWPTVVVLGVALGVSAGKVYDAWTSRAAATASG